MPKEKLGSPVPVRLWESERAKLAEYEKHGLNISDIIRRCVKKALPEVVREIREELQKLEISSSQKNAILSAADSKLKDKH